ncbi:PE domain-containing protein [Amycolatopsis sp. NPDC049868]|uniref:PE domain-containing protein n=1 Tax=Amycolatopsis sp. NPDC049868 TaxID=3363934 RepID=UPI00378FC349
MTGPGSGPQGVYNQLNTTPPQAPPPGSGLIQGAAAAPPPPGPPPNYTELGSGQAKADFAAASANGGWEFDPAAMDQVIKSLEECIENDFSRAQDHATWLTLIQPPGSEVGSEGYAAAANASGAQYQAFLQGARAYTESYLGTLKQIRTAYQNQDQAALDALRQIGKTA